MTSIISTSGYDPVRHNLMGVDILQQSERWKDKQGNVWLLAEMTPRHRRNLLAFLRRNASGIAFRDALIAITGPFAPRGEMASEDFGDYLEERDPDEWLNSTPLVARLAEMVALDDANEAARAAVEVPY